MKIGLSLLLFSLLFGQNEQMTVEEIISAMDKNLYAKSLIMKS